MRKKITNKPPEHRGSKPSSGFVRTIRTTEVLIEQLRKLLDPSFSLDEYLVHLEGEDPFGGKLGCTVDCLSIRTLMQHIESNESSVSIENHIAKCPKCFNAQSIIRRINERQKIAQILPSLINKTIMQPATSSDVGLCLLNGQQFELENLPHEISMIMIAQDKDLSRLDEKSLRLNGIVSSGVGFIVETESPNENNIQSGAELVFKQLKPPHNVNDRCFARVGSLVVGQIVLKGQTLDGEAVIGSTFASIQV